MEAEGSSARWAARSLRNRMRPVTVDRIRRTEPDRGNDT